MKGFRDGFSLPLVSLVLSLFALSVAVGPSRAQESEFGIFFDRPAEGETYYSGPSSLLYSLPVIGWVTGQGIDFTQVSVRLEVFDGQVLVGAVSENALADGTFEFTATANPENSDIQFPLEVMVLGCADLCHFFGDIDLPAGALTLRLTAEDPNGRKAVAERQIKIDRSSYASIPVQVINKDNTNQPLVGITIIGSTRLYLWRARNFTSVTVRDGYAYLRVETLALGSTSYQVRVEPTVIDGVLYESASTVEVVLPPGAISAPPVTLAVSAHTGEISGKLSQPISGSPHPLSIWLIDPQNGSSRQTQVSASGNFQFMDLPLDDYILALDHDHLALEGFSSTNPEIDLTRSLSATLEVPVTPLEGETLLGSLKDENSKPLPFAWITPEDFGAPHMVIPATGNFAVYGLSQASVTVVASAPGFYSQAQVFEAKPDKPVEISLKRRPDTASLPWGSGEVLIPGESEVTLSDHYISLERGWLWGQGADTQSLLIQTAIVEIRLQGANFALENLSEGTGWLYLFDGQAEVRKIGDEEYTLVRAGEMVNLSNEDQLKAVKMDPVVISVLHDEIVAVVVDTWEPAFGAQMRDRLARIGIGTAQMVTFITYSMVFISLILVPLGVLYSFIRRNFRRSNGIQ